MVVDEKKRLDAMIEEDEISYEKDVTCFWRPNPVLFDVNFHLSGGKPIIQIKTLVEFPKWEVLQEANSDY